MRPLWIKAILLLLAVWLAAGGAIWWSKTNKPTPESLAAYVEKLNVANASSAQRAKEMEKIAKQLNTLTYQQRREVRMNRKLDKFFRQLSPDEQVRFLDLTLPEGFKQMMEALKDLQDEEGETPGRLDQTQHAQKIVEQGLKSFYSEASIETKMDLAPLIEQFQHNLQSLR